MSIRFSIAARLTLALGALVSACGGSGDSSGASSGGARSTVTFSVTTASNGATDFPCSDGSGVTQFRAGELGLFCDEPVPESSGVSIRTDAVINLTEYHGSDTYVFQGSNDGNANTVQFTQGDVRFSSMPSYPGFVGTTCSVTVTGPATPSRGDHVSGSFHCDSIQGYALGGGDQYVPPVVTSADGRFEATM